MSERGISIFNLKTAVDFNAEERCARDEVVGLPERREPEGPQGAARCRVTQRKSEVLWGMENARIFLTETLFSLLVIYCVFLTTRTIRG